MSALERAEKLAELVSIKEQSVAHRAAVQRLAELLADSDPEVRAEAASAVWSYPGEAALVAQVLELAQGKPGGPVRRQALGALGRIIQEGDLAGAEAPGYEPAPELGEPPAATFRAARQLLLAVLDDAAAPEGDRRAATESLAFLSDEARVVAAIEALAAREDLPSRLAALRCMGRSGDARWSDAIQAGLVADEPKLVGEAIQAAGQAEAAALAGPLTRIVAGPRRSPTQRILAVEALSRLGGDLAAAPLLQIAENEPEERVRHAAHLALRQLSRSPSPGDAP